MRGTMVETAPGKWRLRVFVGRDGTGRVRHKNASFTGSKREAQKELAKLVADIERGEVATGHSGSVSDLLYRWLKVIVSDHTAYTVKEYRRLVAVNIVPFIGNVRLDKLTGARLDDLYASMMSPDRKPGPLSGASVRRHHFLLHTALGRAVKWGLISSNPADRATPPGLKRSAADAPSLEDVQKLIGAAEAEGDHVLATAIALGAVTGCRWGELCALRWSDVNWQRRVLRRPFPYRDPRSGHRRPDQDPWAAKRRRGRGTRGDAGKAPLRPGAVRPASRRPPLP